MSKELLILLNEDKDYFPGDLIAGYIEVNTTKSADVQCISLNFKGLVEGQGDKKVLIDKHQAFATPPKGQKYTTFAPGAKYKYEFQFQVPITDSLPSSVKIPKVASISYSLIATAKKPSFNFSHTLPTATKEVQIYDAIDIDQEDYCRQINMNTDLGFTNGSKSTQWNLLIPKSAFIRGDIIELECNMNNFPAMKKKGSLKASLVRHIHKTSTAKIVEKNILSTESVDLEITKIASTQSVKITLNVPFTTPVSIFPIKGRNFSISYVIEAELNMKGVKSAIKLNSSYKLEATIVIGTMSKGKHTRSRTTSLRSLSAMSPFARPMSPTESFRASTSTLLSPTLGTTYRNTSAASLPFQRAPIPNHFHGGLTDGDNVKPLSRLDEEQVVGTVRRSYLNRNLSPKSTSKTYLEQDEMIPPMPTDRALTPLPITSSPHEIGPDDIINRGGEYFTVDNEKVMMTGEKVPSLMRCDTLSTASTLYREEPLIIMTAPHKQPIRDIDSHNTLA